MNVNITTVDITDIDYGDRYRKNLSNIADMKVSIQEEGLIHPLNVRLHPRAEEVDYKYLLISGGRRFTALMSLIMDEEKNEYMKVPVIIRKADDYESMRMELMENFAREDMDWKEEATLIEDIVKLEKKLAKEKGKNFTIRDTAKLLKLSKSSVHENLELAKAKDIPEVAKQKTKSDAKKVLNKLAKESETKDKAAEIEKHLEENVSDAKADKIEAKNKKGMLASYIIGDAVEGVKNLGKGNVNLFEIDPPYAIDLHSMKMKSAKSNQVTTDYNEVDAEAYKKMMKSIIHDAYKALSKDGWLVCWFASDPWWDWTWKTILEAGFDGMAIPLIWDKSNGQTMQPDKYMARSYEMAFYARKGDAKIFDQGKSSIFHHKPMNPDDKSHPTQRPIELIEAILYRFFGSYSGKMICSPFAGSGTTLLAAANQNHFSIGYDLTEKYRDAYVVRVGNHKHREYK